MDREALQRIRDWFTAYSEARTAECPGERMPLESKTEHTLKVSSYCARIASDEGLPESELMLAEAAGLLHDIGRFSQYIKYGTFLDSESENHGALGAKVIEKEGVLEFLPGKEMALLTKAVRFHNAFSMPKTKDPLEERILLILRDSDKLDVWRVMADNYESPDQSGGDVMLSGLEDSGSYNPDMLEDLAAGKKLRLGDAEHLNDLKLMHVSWARELKFRSSCRAALEAGEIKRVCATLPQTPEIKRVLEGVFEYLRACAGP
jgi:putative nucleotidyltransferase with HDIG domain